MQRLGVFSPRGFARSPQRLNVLGWYHVLGAVMIFLMGNLLGVLLAPPPAAKAGIWDSWSLIVSDTSGKILGIAAILWIAQRAFVEPVGRPGGLGWNWRRFGGGFWRGIAAYLLLLPVLIMVADITSAVLKWQHAPKPPPPPAWAPGTGGASAPTNRVQFDPHGAYAQQIAAAHAHAR